MLTTLKKNSNRGFTAVMMVMMMSIVLSILAIVMSKKTVSATLISESSSLKETQWSIRQKLNGMLRSSTNWQATLNDTDNRLTAGTVTLASCFLTLHPDGLAYGFNSANVGYPAARNGSASTSSMQYDSGGCTPQNAAYNIVQENKYPGGTYTRFTLRDARNTQITIKSSLRMLKDDGTVCADVATDGFTCRWSVTSEFYRETAVANANYNSPAMQSRLVIRFHLAYVKPDTETNENVADMWWDTIFLPDLIDSTVARATPNNLAEYTVTTRTDSCLGVVPYGTFTVPSGTSVSFRMREKRTGAACNWSWAVGNAMSATAAVWPASTTVSLFDDRNMLAVCDAPTTCQVTQAQVGDSLALYSTAVGGDGVGTEWTNYRSMLTSQITGAWTNVTSAGFTSTWAGCTAGNYTSLATEIAAAMATIPVWVNSTVSASADSNIALATTCGGITFYVTWMYSRNFLAIPAGYGPRNKTGGSAANYGITLAAAISTSSATCIKAVGTPYGGAGATCRDYTFAMPACSDRFSNAVCETTVQMTNGRRLDFRTTGGALAGAVHRMELGSPGYTPLQIYNQRRIRGTKEVTISGSALVDCGNLRTVDPPINQTPSSACENGYWTADPVARKYGCTSATEFPSCVGKEGAAYTTCDSCTAYGAVGLTAFSGQSRTVERFCPYAPEGSTVMTWAADFDTCKSTSDNARCVNLTGGKIRCECAEISGSCRWVSYLGQTCP